MPNPTTEKLYEGCRIAGENDVDLILAVGGGSVITNHESKLKIGHVFGDNVFPKFSILNPKLTYTLPHYHMVAGFFDIMSHILEQYFSGTDDNTSDYLMEGLPKFRRYAVNVWDVNPEGMTEEAVAEEGLRRMEEWMKEMGLVMNISELGVTEEMLEGIADGSFIMTGGYKTLTHEEIVKILRESM